AASSSATARPRPRLAAATSATLSLSLRSIGWSSFVLSEVCVSLDEPVLSWRTEDVNIERVFECFRFVLHVRRNMQHFTCQHVDHLRFVFSDPETQAALDRKSV